MTLWRKRTSSIVACRGRRRIGKSTLFSEFARRSADVYIEIEGLAPQQENPPTVQDRHLGVGNAIVESAAPYRNSKRGNRDGVRGCQIDLLIQTARTAYVVEVKRKRFIGEEIVAEVEEKVRRLPLRRDLSARPVLVYDGELQPSVEGTGYFDAVINARQLLEA